MRLPFTYPPFALIALAPLALMNFTSALWTLWGASLGATIYAIFLLIRSIGIRLTVSSRLLTTGGVFMSLLILEPVRSDMDYGQIELILMAVIVIDFFGLPGMYRGILIGAVAAIKLTPLIFIATLLVMRDFRSAARAVISLIVCTLAASIIFPSDSRKFWLLDVTQPGRTGNVTYAGNQCWYAVIYRIKFLSDDSELIWIMLSIITVAAGLFIAWRCANSNRLASALLSSALTGLLVSPISWSHHWVWVLLIPPIALGEQAIGFKSPARKYLWGLVLLACIAPYWLFQNDKIGQALQALLPLYTGIALAMWAASEWRTWRSNLLCADPDLPAEERAHDQSKRSAAHL